TPCSPPHPYTTLFRSIVTNGATLTVTGAAHVVVKDDQMLTVAVGGRLTVTSPAAFQVEEYFGGAEGITVNGTMAVTNAAFSHAGTTYDKNSLIQLSAGGQLDFNGGTFAWHHMTVNAGATANIKYISLNGQLQIDSTATINIRLNDR